ncbi:MAG: hypothetical protein ISQ66_07100 [Luminiphilus sp.]|jgi:hypothetical protein|nr:hypothetical protein [Luminiphilus sp.]
MPPMTLLGWFHTVMGVIAILTAAYALYQHRIIRAADKSGRAYLLITLVVAGSALAIYNQGGFGVGHILAVLTLTALLAGYLLETLAPFGKWSVYLQTGAYTATVLFHMIPAITDFLRRLPVGDPFVDSLDAPLVQSFHLAFLAAFVVGVLAQWMWLTRSRD